MICVQFCSAKHDTSEMQTTLQSKPQQNGRSLRSKSKAIDENVMKQMRLKNPGNLPY